MNGHIIDYTARADSIRAVLALRAKTPSMRGHVLAAQLAALHRIEHGMVHTLQRDGMSAEAAAQSALAFMSSCVEHYVKCS